MPHPHVWREAWKDVWAFFSKRDDGQSNDLFWAKGDVDQCMFCEEMQLRPYGKGLAVVRVILVAWGEVPIVKEAA